MTDSNVLVEQEEENAKSAASELGLVYCGNGSFISVTCADDPFWNDAATNTIHLQHRIPELKAWLTYQYKVDGKYVRLRTLQYKMTTRPVSKPWYRGNLNVEFISAGYGIIESPDAMWQQVQPSDFISYVRCAQVNWNTLNVLVRICCNFDGTDNDGWEITEYVNHPLPA